MLGGEYRIESPLAAGGMGAVYVARQISTNKRRALKLMHARLVPDVKSRQRFIQEAQVASHIESEHVVEVVGAGVDDESGVPWIAMELLEGEDLHALVARQGALPASEVRELLAQLGHALGAAHAAGIVHRDLKPENLFLARARRQGAERVLKVLDFGIATALPESERAAAVTTAIGSPFWMAPEQAQRGALIRPATDVWPLGLIAFFLLTGRRYWRTGAFDPAEASAPALLAEILMDPIEPPSQRAAELGASASLPLGFDDWFLHCVARDPGERFVEASAAVRALDGVLGGAAVDRRAALGVADTAMALAVATPPAPMRAAPTPVRTQALPATTSVITSSPPSSGASAPSSSRRGFLIAALGVLGVAAAALVAAGIIVMSGAASEHVPPAPPSRQTDSPVAPPPSPSVVAAVEPEESHGASAPITEEEPTEAVAASPEPPEPEEVAPAPAEPRRPRRGAAPPRAPTVTPAPLPAPTPPTPEPPATRTVEAGPLWNDAHANEQCPRVCASRGMRWTGHWRTTVPGRMSVCECASR